MEIPRYWREQSTNIRFEGWFKQVEDKATGRMDIYFKYPGGEIPFVNPFDFEERMLRKGFDAEGIQQAMDLFVATVAAEASIPAGEVFYSRFQKIGSKVGE